VIPIRAAAPSPAVAAPAPAIAGPRSVTDRLLAALDADMAGLYGRGVAPGEWLAALQLDDGEASVRLRRDLGCRTADVAGLAFEALRRQLPDTDIYVGV
jgi:hypothetical protein